MPAIGGRSVVNNSAATGGPTPAGGLGLVMRFAPEAKGEGIRHFERSGLKVARSSDFRNATSVPNDFNGADVQYFERFGIAIIRRDPERARPALARAAEQNIVTAARSERLYRALGDRDAVSPLVNPFLPDPSAAGGGTAPFDEVSCTWGLQAAKVDVSSLSGAGIKVAILDTGFDDRHPDFHGRTVTQKLFATNSTPNDTVGHGTHCTGTACGPLHPVQGPRFGVAYDAQIYAGKILGDDRFGTDRSVIAGMDWALDQGCHIISMSIGVATKLGDSPIPDYEQIGKVCLDAGTLVVAAAGNESKRPGLIEPIDSPANASTIMAVAAIDRTMQVASFSCGGLNPSQEVDIAGPGVDILSTLPGGGYARMDGTSMATPHVAGIAALIAQSDAQYRGRALWARLLEIAQPLGLLAQDVGKGLVQAPPK
jgi:subtilisin family serine protease